ncbi:MAG: hypothetical protein H7A52_00380 [Akkermansiaceae bacterium]|nr:hypothetical protein [Akkermansiaceae bacterium]
METWESGYTGADATGAHVIGYWKFDGDTPGAALRDVSGKGHDLKIEGGGILGPKGRTGGALESFPGFPVQDKRHAAATPARPDLSPRGAFTLEMWIAPKPEFEDRLRCFLLDKKYVDHTDFQWQIGEADKAGLRRLWVNIGFGSDSRIFYSDPARFEPGVWRHVAFTYDGAGEGRFYLDGASAGVQRHEGVTAPVPGNKPLSIGDRLGSNYGGFPGFIDEVRICQGVLAFEPVLLSIQSTRSVWRRMEKAAPIEILCTNLRRAPLKGAKLHLSWSGGGETKTETLPELPSGETHIARFAVDTALKPGDYDFRARLELTEPKPLLTERSADFTLVPRPPPGRLPVVMWGVGIGGVEREADRLRDLGFTHCLGMGADYGAIWKAGAVTSPEDPERIAENRRLLDVALKHGLSLIANLSPGRWLENDPANLRVGRDGKPFTRRDICASTPAFAPFFENVGASVSKAYGDHPAFSMGLVNTEVRDASQPSFNAVDLENYRDFSGGDIPPEVAYRGGVEWTKLKGFPEDRVIPDDHPILRYYRWFWTVGDGWNALHSALSDGLKKNAPPGFRTFFDPAARQPSISGAGGGVDILSHWTYTYPDPQRIGLCTDQLFAMAEAGGRGQDVMKMTQVIWYRSQTAPIPKAGGDAPGAPVAWEDHDPDAAYITIAPMHLREAFWTKIARPIRGIMYHGWQSLVPTDSPGAYRHTNPHTQHELKRLAREVVEPLGPTLLQLSGVRSDVAYLESFTSQMFARRGGYGSNLGWSADVWLALQHAHIPCDVIFEETLLKDGLDGRRFLVMPDCDVLTESVAKQIADWRKAGGRIVADENLCPALKADLTLTSFKRVKKADQDKAKVLELAAKLRSEMPNLGLTRDFDCDNPEIVLHTRKHGDADYLFAINDRREFGAYVGPHGLVMENGLPSSATLTIPDGKDKHVYDLLAGHEIPMRDGRFPVSLGPCDGRLFLVTPAALGILALSMPESAKPGESVEVKITLDDESNQPLRAIVPARLDIRDANGRLAEGGGYYGIRDGALTVKLDLAPNEDPGTWEIAVRESARGETATAYLTVKP